MKAAVYLKYGPPEVVSVQEIPMPAPKANEVLIRVHASTVNRTDAGFRSAEYFVSRFFSGLFKPRRTVLGCEFAGVVVEKGSAVTRFNIGDRVFGYDDAKFGGHAEWIAQPENGHIALTPNHLDDHTAAAMTEGSHYALNYIRATGIGPESEVLVYGCTGGIGSAAVQICKHLGAHVTAVCGTAHQALAHQLGADIVVDYQMSDFTKTDRRYDVVLDAVGKSSWRQCLPLLKPQGFYTSTELGRHGENVWRSILLSKSKGKRLLFPIPSISQVDVEWLADLSTKRAFTPVIDRVYSLDDIIEAHRYVSSGQKIGNVVISLK
jgi:NADPH:quinone reductase-like Zn-dependent oxidoreductase